MITGWRAGAVNSALSAVQELETLFQGPMTPLVTIQLMGLAGRLRRKLATGALHAEMARVRDCVYYYDFEEGGV